MDTEGEDGFFGYEVVIYEGRDMGMHTSLTRLCTSPDSLACRHGARLTPAAATGANSGRTRRSPPHEHHHRIIGPAPISCDHFGGLTAGWPVRKRRSLYIQ